MYLLATSFSFLHATTKNNVYLPTRRAFGYPFGFGLGISDFRIFRYRNIESVRVFLYFGSGSDIFNSGSVISNRVRIFRF